MIEIRAGAAARAYSSWKMTCCSSVAPRPPCSAGQPRQVQPAAARCRFQASRSAALLVLAARAAGAAQARELAGQAGFQPVADALAELLVGRGEAHLGLLLIALRA